MKKTASPLKLVVASLLFVLVCALGAKRVTAEVLSRALRLSFSQRVFSSSYPVEGLSEVELTNSMRERGPLGHDGQRYYGYTAWYFKLRSGLNTKRVHPVKCKILVNLPRLYADERRKEDLVKRWGVFLDNMVAHESRHVKNAVRACRGLSKNSILSNPKLQAVAKRLKARDVAYDELTEHGKHEGVTLFGPR